MRDILNNILIKDGLVVTMDDENRILKGDVFIEGGEIKKVGNSHVSEADQIIDAGGKIVLPGFVCGFTRPCDIIFRGADLKVESPSDLIQTYQRIRWPLDDEITKGDIFHLTLSACALMLRTGTTFFAGLHSSQSSIGKSLDEVASAVTECGMRGLIGFEASERHTHAEGAKGMRENIRFLKKMDDKSWNETAVKGIVGLDSPFLTSDELLNHGSRVANEFDVPLVMSVGKSQVDVCHNIENFGKSVLERLWDIGVLSDKTVLGDCVHLSENDISIMEKTGTNSVLNTMSNVYQGEGTARYVLLKKRNVCFGIGNDGFIFDSLQNLRGFYLAQRTKIESSTRFSPIDVIRHATIESAEVYGLGNKIGSIEAGKKADITIIDTSYYPTPVTRTNVADHILESAKGSDVETVIVDGEIVVRNRRIKTLDVEKVMKNSKKITEKIWKKY